MHGIGKGIDPNILPEKQVIKPIISSETKGVTQNKPRLGQDRAGIKQKIKPVISPSLNKAIIQLTEKPILQPQNTAQPKTALKISVPESSRPHEKFIPVPDYVIPQTRSGDDSKSRTIKGKTM